MSDGVEFIPGVTVHARERMAERLGRNLTRGEWLDVVDAILSGRATLLASDRRGEQYLWAVGGDAFRLSWRPENATIVSVMPASAALGRNAQAAKEGRIRPSLRHKAHYRGGKRLTHKTTWQEEPTP